jgi:mannose-6-phosphate isomerase-like protein (cupin superfamily)
MQAFDLADLATSRAAGGGPWLEFLRSASLSVGLYELAAGAVDPQQPHSEDEVYYVVAGDAQIEVAGEQRPVGPGSVVFVAARVPHRFHTIRQDLRVLVFFAPPEGSQAG